MTTTLIVLAHPEPRSFNAQWAEASAAAVRAEGGEVLVSDLCAMGFDPVERAAHYADPVDPFDPLKAQAAASEAGVLPADVAGEVAKLRAADRVIFHFPMWWFAPPAILKGWCERVLAHRGLHDTSNRFDTGRFAHVSALMCVTTGSNAAESGPDGREGNARMHLWPLAYTLRYLGMEVLEPVFVHGVHGYFRGDRKVALETRLQSTLASQGALIAGWDDRARWPFHADADFDGDGRLRAGVPSLDPFIRRET